MGAEQVYGDDASDSIVEFKTTNADGQTELIKQLIVKTKSQETQGIAIILKARAAYTDSARMNKVQGKVALRVSFLANGAVGSIEVVSRLDEGLTETAIQAARKIVFIPAQREGARYSVTKMVEYSFTIY